MQFKHEKKEKNLFEYISSEKTWGEKSFSSSLSLRNGIDRLGKTAAAIISNDFCQFSVKTAT